MKHSLREYTGLERTPSSLAWLIRKRASVLGRIEHKQVRIVRWQEDIKVLRGHLRAIDQVIRQHEAPVEPEKIHGRKTRRKSLVGYGQVGRFLLEQLREADGKPCSTTELTVRFLQSIGAEVTMLALKDARQRIRYRLKDYAAEGVVEPRHQADARGVIQEGLWVLAPDKPLPAEDN